MSEANPYITFSEESEGPRRSPAAKPVQAPATASSSDEPVGQFKGDPAQVLAAIKDLKDPVERDRAMRAFQNQYGSGSENTAPNPYASVDVSEPPTAPDFAKDVENRRLALAAGAGAGAFLRYKGRNPVSLLAPGKGVFSPDPERVEFVNERLRQMTRSPTANVQGMTPEQVERLLQGGEGPTLGTSGRQRGETFNLETSRRSRLQNELESLVNRQFPGTPDPITSVGEPLVQTRPGLILPQSVATQQAEQQAAQIAQRSAQQAAEAERAAARAQRKLQVSGLASGTGRIAQGTVGGGLTGLQGYEMATQKKPIDWSQWLSLLGNLGITFGGPRLGIAGGLAQLPYAIKNRDELARTTTLGDINPTVFGGSPEALDTPIGNEMRPR